MKLGAAIAMGLLAVVLHAAPAIAADDRRAELQTTAALPAPNPAGAASPTTLSPPVPETPPAGGHAALAATDARLVGDDRRTRLVVDLAGSTASLNFHAFVLPDPYRVVIDLPEIAFDVPPDAGKQRRGLVSAYRFGLIAVGRSRIVLDATGPVSVDKSFLLDAADGQPARLVIDLVKTDRLAFMHTVATQKGSEITPNGGGSSAPVNLLPENQSGLPVVVIDPGHGGIDAGATSRDGTQEKNIVLAFARVLADKINNTGRYRAVLTRDNDTFITLMGRIEFARANKASLFVSIHADTLHDPFGVRGATIYTLSDRASDTESARYAEQENKADAIAGVDLSSEPGDVADILIDLTRRETKAFSNRFAKVLIDEFQSAATLNKNPHRSAGFLVLTAPDIPSVLLELGYLSSRDDVKLLTSDEWRDHATDAVLTAVDAFFAQRRRGTTQALP